MVAVVNRIVAATSAVVAMAAAGLIGLAAVAPVVFVGVALALIVDRFVVVLMTAFGFCHGRLLLCGLLLLAFQLRQHLLAVELDHPFLISLG